ncbi:MAG: NAD(P)-binding protein, partial [Phycisphaerae bacterium]
MDPSQRFSYRSLEELVEAIRARGLVLPVCEDLSVLREEVHCGRLVVPNRLVVQPMEGCDATANGAPTDLTIRRYRRFGAGGAGLIWWEATAIAPQARANPRQLYLHAGTVDGFAEMVRAARAAARESVGCEPICVLQMTHSGRYSRPGSRPAPIIAHHSPVLDPAGGIAPDHSLISDEELDALQNAYVETARLAVEAGFDAVDVKSCHRYLVSELLASFTREDSRYGGSYANRTRLLRETAAKIRDALGDSIEVTCRLNVYDGIARPYGWGVDARDAGQCDLTEPIRLIGELKAAGLGGINITIGNPYWNPHVNRPADWMIDDWPDPPEGPLAGVARIIHVVRDIQKAYPDLPVVGSGYTWLRQYVPQFAAGAISAGWASLVGLGRGALAYPDFAGDILRRGAMDPHKVCILCSSCTQIMRDRGRSGCVVRDHEVYAPIFREGRRRDVKVLQRRAAECRRCPDAMCVAGCPAGVDVPGFLGALADGEEEKAYRILRAGNILPEICGAVCPVEVQCQAACIRNYIADGPVPIGEIQRYLSERAVEAGWAALAVPEHPTGRRVAVIGAGPAGLSAAAELLRRGHSVAVLD